jgi:hypothetical protein
MSSHDRDKEHDAPHDDRDRRETNLEESHAAVTSTGNMTWAKVDDPPEYAFT